MPWGCNRATPLFAGPVFHEDGWCLQHEFADQSLAGPLGVLSQKPEVSRPFWEHALCQEPGSTTTVPGSGGSLPQPVVC